ncbi:DNA polymerase III subunit delta [Oscillospiraceae bacterium CM]|nr:DNA polymerase III subunit delta [Oscillospiraceae bacterium CM]
MAQKKDSSGYDTLRAAISTGTIGNLYIFHGEERYLLENSLGAIRERLVVQFPEFNHKRFDGRGLTMETLAEACDTLPVFSERTLVEVEDFDIFKAGEETKKKLYDLLSALPDTVCLIFIYDTLDYKPDGRQKIAALIKDRAVTVEFTVQDASKLVRWIKAHVADAGKKIETTDAEYLALMTGGLMTTLNGEIEKVCQYASGSTVTRADIDALVVPVLDAVTYKLTDQLADGQFSNALQTLSDLLSLHEPPHKLLFSIGLKLRQLLAARVLLDNALGEKTLMTLAGIRYDFQARGLYASARKTPLSYARQAVTESAETALRLNGGGDPEKLLTELVVHLAVLRKGAAS